MFAMFSFVFPQQLQPSRRQYREGEEYCVLHHIQNGSYGDVFCVRDKRTGFKCAAKRVSQETLSHSFKAQICTTQRLSYNDSVKKKKVSEVLFSALSSGGRRFLWVTSAARRWARGALSTLLVSSSSSGLWGTDSTSCSSWTWSQVNFL